MATNTFMVTEDKSTVQKLVDYNSNTLLPYTILDAITEYTVNASKTAAFGMNLIYKKMIEFIGNNKVTFSSINDNQRYYPVLYDSQAGTTGAFTDGLAINTTTYSYRTADSSYEFLSQDGTFVRAPEYFIKSEFVGTNINGNSANINSAFYFDTKSADNTDPAKIWWTMTFTYDSDHFAVERDGKHFFAPAGSLYNFLHSIDFIEYVDNGYSTHTTFNNDNSQRSGRYIPLFYKSSANLDNNSVVAECEVKDVLALTCGHALNLTAHTDHLAMITSSQSDSSIANNDNNKYIVYQDGPTATKFLKVPSDSSTFNPVSTEGQDPIYNGPVSLVSDNGILRWGSSGIAMTEIENDTNIYYILGTNTGYTARKSGMYFSTKTYFKEGNIYQYSDERLKSFEDTHISLEDFNKILVSKFYWKNDEKQVSRFGVSAQSVEQVVPELVSETNGIKSVQYDKLGALSIYGIQLLINEVNSLKAEIKELKAQLNK